MFKHKLLLIMIISFIGITGHTQDQAGFDEICTIYTEAINSSMAQEQLSDYIFDNVERRIIDKDALQSHEVVFNLSPEERYSIFKQSAELSLKRKWDCDAVKELMR